MATGRGSRGRPIEQDVTKIVTESFIVGLGYRGFFGTVAEHVE